MPIGCSKDTGAPQFNPVFKKPDQNTLRVVSRCPLHAYHSAKAAGAARQGAKLP
jgi:hypothetical protein